MAAGGLCISAPAGRPACHPSLALDGFRVAQHSHHLGVSAEKRTLCVSWGDGRQAESAAEA